MSLEHCIFSDGCHFVCLKSEELYNTMLSALIAPQLAKRERFYHLVILAGSSVGSGGGGIAQLCPGESSRQHPPVPGLASGRRDFSSFSSWGRRE